MAIDLIGIGVGPANLSLAALLTTARERGLTSLSSIFLERNPEIFWHTEQMFPGTLMQTEFYRDLVTPVDPTNRFSFLNYLRLSGRLDQFFCSSTIYPTRVEFQAYFNWVAKQIPDLVFDAQVNSVEYDPDTKLFVVDVDPDKRYESKHIVIGSGARPKSNIETEQTGRVVDVSKLLGFKFPKSLQRVLVVGGGQSAAECVNYLLDEFYDTATRITWVTSEGEFKALDTSNFSREVLSIGHALAFASLPEVAREKINRDDKSVVNGITPLFAQALYQRLYRLKYFTSDGMRPSVHIQVNTEVVEIHDDGRGVAVTARTPTSSEARAETFDCVILCTGVDEESIFDSTLIGSRLKARLDKNENRAGYVIPWDGPDDRMIFVQSQNTRTHGLGDANFVTAPGRNACILNAIDGKEVYGIDDKDRLVALR